jgi:hypothetical protein
MPAGSIAIAGLGGTNNTMYAKSSLGMLPAVFMNVPGEQAYQCTTYTADPAVAAAMFALLMALFFIQLNGT